MGRKSSVFFRTLCFLLFTLLSSAVLAEKAAEARLSLTGESRLSFTNAVYHYVSLSAEVSGADQLILRVYKPDGTQAKFKTKALSRAGKEAVRFVTFSVKESGNPLQGAEVLFASGCAAGIWTLEVQALRKKEEVALATLEVEVREPYEIAPADYDLVRTLMPEDSSKLPVEAGRIRFVTQLPEDRCFVSSLWKSRYYDLTEQARSKCTRAVFSMALSWLGIDCTPVRMSEITKAAEIYHTFEHVVETLGNVERKDGTLAELWERYEAGEASPVAVHFTYSGGMHAFLLIARDSLNPDLYYAVNPSEGVNASALGGLTHDHIIPVVIEDGILGGVIQSPLIRKYNKGKLDVICQWSLTEDP